MFIFLYEINASRKPKLLKSENDWIPNTKLNDNIKSKFEEEKIMKKIRA